MACTWTRAWVTSWPTSCAKELAEAQAELDTYLPEGLPFQFNWTNRYHLSPIIFGGRSSTRADGDHHQGGNHSTPAARHPQGVCLCAERMRRRGRWRKAGYTLAPPVEGEGRRLRQVQGGRTAGEYKTKKVKVDDYDKPKSRMVDDYWEFLATWNLNLNGQQYRGACTPVASDVIKILTENTNIPFLQTLGRVVAISKDLGTYFISEDGRRACSRWSGMMAWCITSSTTPAR